MRSILLNMLFVFLSLLGFLYIAAILFTYPWLLILLIPGYYLVYRWRQRQVRRALLRATDILSR